MTDTHFMQIALALGARMLGRTAPNPAVGCVIVKDGAIIGRGWTAAGGRPHAEVEALNQAGKAASGATAYVSLEPCAHHGRTPPCAAALITAGIARVVIAVQDPDPRVAGKGIAMLKEAGIAVTPGVLEKEAAESHAGFFTRIQTGRPLFTLKMAVSADGYAATGDMAQPFISGEIARAYAHRLRATHDAIMIGVGTAISDDPMLDCRLPGCENLSSVRIVVDTHLRLPLASKLVQSAAKIPLWIFTASDGGAAHEQRGAKIIQTVMPVTSIAQKLGELGLTRVMVEGGPMLAASFLDAGLIDRVEWVTSPLKIGEKAPKATETAALQRIFRSGLYIRSTARQLEQDRLESFRRLG